MKFYYRLCISTQKRAAFRLITEKDITGFAPVHYAAKYGHLQVRALTILLKPSRFVLCLCLFFFFLSFYCFNGVFNSS